MSFVHTIWVKPNSLAPGRDKSVLPFDHHARIGLAENGGGLIGFEEAACSVILLEGAG